MRALFAAIAMLASTSATAQMGMPSPLPPEMLVDPVEPAKVEWLTNHVVAEGPVTGGIRFALPESVYASRLILLGESHGVAAPQVLDLELLTHLNQRMGLRDYLAEIDPIQAVHFNRYLDHGDEAALDRVFAYWRDSGAQWGNTAFRDKVRAIRALNQSLPAGRRVRFHGIDAVQDWALAADWIAEGDSTRAKALLATPAAERARAYQMALGERPGAEAAALRATLSDLAAGARREAVIFANYARAVEGDALGERPAYGLWGMFHIMQGRINGAQPFAAMVATSDLPAAQAITSIAILSLDSAVQVPVPLPHGLTRMRLTQFNIDGPFVMVKGAATLRAGSQPSRITIFDLTGEGTPFGPLDFTTIKTSVGQDFTPDEVGGDARPLTQYIGVFRDSDWAAPLPQ